ncbi:MAG: hypothetical protein HQL87_11675 [Magnetococcales bacterium]|nr:hypothetical protein [Magnetococcales bacterium]
MRQFACILTIMPLLVVLSGPGYAQNTLDTVRAAALSSNPTMKRVTGIVNQQLGGGQRSRQSLGTGLAWQLSRGIQNKIPQRNQAVKMIH